MNIPVIVGTVASAAIVAALGANAYAQFQTAAALHEVAYQESKIGRNIYYHGMVDYCRLRQQAGKPLLDVCNTDVSKWGVMP